MSLFNKALKIINSSNNAHKIFNRQSPNFRNLMQVLKNPYKEFKCIHVTGTNGKGSVSLKIASVLQHAGYKVGLYTSPHLFTFRQRISINNIPINKQQLANYIIHIHNVASINNIQLSFFQYLTATGFLYFRDEKCDFGSIEVGLGGRYDTTNVIDPSLSIITSLGLQHTDILGNTIDKIAYEKGGIIKQRKNVVLGPTSNNQIIIDIANAKKSKVWKVEQILGRDFQEENNEIVKVSIKALSEQLNITINEDSIKKGLQARQPCRMQQLDKKYIPEWCKKQIFFDVGHNPPAILKSIEYYKKNIQKKNDKLVVIFGASSKKQVQPSLNILCNIAQVIYLVEANNPRSMKISTLESIVPQTNSPHKFRVVSKGQISKTLNYALAQPQINYLLIIGSFFIMPQAQGYFQPQILQISEQERINEIYQLVQKNYL